MIDLAGFTKIEQTNSFLSITVSVLFVSSQRTEKSTKPRLFLTSLKKGSTAALNCALVNASLNSKSCALAAVAMGATLIEKHFTINRNNKGPDHKASLEPEELLSLVENIRKIEICLGSGHKKPQKGELSNMKIARKSIVAKTNIKKGEIFSEFNITTKRPGTGISPQKWDKLIGRKSLKNYLEGMLINEKI